MKELLRDSQTGICLSALATGKTGFGLHGPAKVVRNHVGLESEVYEGSPNSVEPFHNDITLQNDPNGFSVQSHNSFLDQVSPKVFV